MFFVSDRLYCYHFVLRIRELRVIGKHVVIYLICHADVAKREGAEGKGDRVTEVDGSIMVSVSGKASVECQLSPSDITPAAIELSLPWKRTVESTPLASSFTQSMAGDDNPQMCEVPSWVDNYSYTAHAPMPKPNSTEQHHLKEDHKVSIDALAASTPLPHHDHIDPQGSAANAQTLYSDPEQFRTSLGNWSESHVSLTAVRGSDPSITPLLPSSPSNVTKKNKPNTADDRLSCSGDMSKLNNFLQISVANGSKDAEASESDFSLPLPWVSSSDIYMPRLSCDNGSNVIPAHLPQVLTAPELFCGPDDDQVSSCHLSESNEAAVSEDNDSCIPPPWRNTNSGARTGMPVISPSASFEMDSLQPQPSSQSQRLSEVASHHSEPYLMHHHLIDLPPRPPVDYEIATTLESLDIEDGQTDYMSRVHQWLLSNNPEEQEPLSDDFTFSAEPKAQNTTEHTELHLRKDNHHFTHHGLGDHSAEETNV